MRAIYNLFFKRSSTYVVVVCGSVFFFERAFDLASEELFKKLNKGKLWDDIKHKYE